MYRTMFKICVHLNPTRSIQHRGLFIIKPMLITMVVTIPFYITEKLIFISSMVKHNISMAHKLSFQELYCKTDSYIVMCILQIYNQ